jgi:hypothetical protein
VNKWTFLFFVKTYGLDGPVIEFKAPQPVVDPAVAEAATKAAAKKGPAPTSAEGEAAVTIEDQVKQATEKARMAKLREGGANPKWLSLVKIEKHARAYPLQELANSIIYFKTGLPYGVVSQPKMRAGCLFFATENGLVGSALRQLMTLWAQ